jgi:ACS family hexuronate transporter-like MFS transporter
MGHALASTIAGFGIARIALGLGEGGNFPAAIKTVAQWFPRAERAFATTLFNSGANVGALLAPALIPWLALTFGWHSAFIVAGVAGFIWLAFWLPLYSAPRDSRWTGPAEVAHIESDAESEGDEPRLSWGSLLGYRQSWSFILAKLLTDPVWWFFLIWLPDYFKKIHGLDLKNSSAKLITIYALVTVLSIAGGFAAKWLAGRGWDNTRTRKLSLVVCAAAVFPIWFVPEVGAWGAVCLIGLAGGAHQLWSATIFSTVSDMFPKRAIASLIGIGGMAGAIGGMIFPVVSGWILDQAAAAPAGGQATGTGSGAGYAILFTWCSLAYLIAFAINHVLAPRFVMVQIRTPAAGPR